MRRRVRVGDRISAITLSDTDGKPIELATRLTAPAIIPLVRYYGCMPCQAYLRELEAERGLLESWGFVLFGVGGAADYQARHLRTSRAIRRIEPRAEQCQSSHGGAATMP